MRRRGDHVQLKTIAAIRDLQRLAAENRAARAAAALREKESHRDDHERQRQSLEDSWTASLSEPSIDMSLSSLWSAALLRQETVVRECRRDAETAAADVKRRASDLHVATMRRDVAKDMAQSAVKARQRRLEEIALQDVADRHAQRRRMP